MTTITLEEEIFAELEMIARRKLTTVTGRRDVGKRGKSHWGMEFIMMNESALLILRPKHCSYFVIIP